MNPPPDQHDLNPEPFTLSDADKAALDALVDARFDAQRVPAQLRDRAGRVAALMGLLDAGLDDLTDARRRSLLTTVTMARVARTPMAGADTDRPLSLEDGASIDALVDSGWDVSRVAPALAPRAARVANLLHTLDAGAPSGAFSADERAARVERALDAIQRRIDEDERSRQFGANDFVLPRRGLRLRELFSTAAALMLGFAVLWPIASSFREELRVTACQNSMRAAGAGFGLYAGDHSGRLPVVSAGFRGSWWNVGTPGQSNSANLFELARTGHAVLRDLACPGNPGAPVHMHDAEQRDWRAFHEVSYSYQIPTRPRAMWNGTGRVVVMADKSPIVERARFGERFDPEARSRNHSGRGQNALFNDGSVVFLASPVLANGDNIWLPQHLTLTKRPTLQGTERPDDDTDTFVGP